MSLYNQIVNIYPELLESSFFADGTIVLQNDSDGLGDYIAKWDYDQPIPAGLSLGKPSA